MDPNPLLLDDKDEFELDDRDEFFSEHQILTFETWEDARVIMRQMAEAGWQLQLYQRRKSNYFNDFTVWIVEGSR